jgi:hypothetical protein
MLDKILDVVAHDSDYDIVSYETVLKNDEIDLSTIKRDDVVVVGNKRYVVDNIKHITESKFSGHYHLLLKILPYKKSSITRKFKRDGKAVVNPTIESRNITRVIPSPIIGPVLESFGYDANVKEFDSHILDALGRKKQLVEEIQQLEQLIEFLRLPTITINQPNEETKMTETLKAKTGKEILDEGIAAVDISAGNQLRNMIVDTTGKIRQREMWIANRTKQIAQLKEIQKEAVKSYDEGTFAHNSKAYNERINAIENERVS